MDVTAGVAGRDQAVPDDLQVGYLLRYLDEPGRLRGRSAAEREW